MQREEPDRIALTHFTSQSVAAQILDGWRREVLEQPGATEDVGPNEVSLRLYSRYGMNDPTEYIHTPREVDSRRVDNRENGTRRTRLVFPDTAFVFCGSREAKSEDLDRLDLWRAYGSNGNGIAITTIWSRTGLTNDKLDIVPVKYVPNHRFAELKEENEKIQMDIDRAIEARNTAKAKELHQRRMVLEVGYKGSDYKSEDEVRIVYYAGDKSNEVPRSLVFTAESGRLRAYVEHKVKIGVGQTLAGLYVTIGPRVPEHEASHWQSMADWTIRQLGLSGTRSTSQSRLTYVG